MALTQQDKEEMYQYLISKGKGVASLDEGDSNLSNKYLAPVLEYTAGGSASKVVRLAVSLLQGKSAILRKSGDLVQWQLQGTSTWDNLYSLEDYRGSPGKNPEFRKNGDNLEYKLSGEADTAYRILLALSNITGPQGDYTVLRVSNNKLQYKYSKEDDTAYRDLLDIETIRGQQGRPGKDFQILGYYDTISDLRTAITSPEPGEAYGVGTVAPYPIYIWDAVSQDWINNGAIQGPVGLSGKSARINKDTSCWQEYDDDIKTWKDTEYIAQYALASIEKDGLMSKEDKTKLDGISGGDIEVSKENIEKVLTGSISSHSHDTIKELSTMPTDVWDGTTISTTLSGTGTKEDPFLVQSCADYIHLYCNPSLYSPVIDFGPDFNPLAVDIKHIRIEKNLDFSDQEVNLSDALHDMKIDPSENASKVLLFVAIDGQNAQIRNINFAGTFSILPLAAYSLVKNLHVLGGKFSVSTDELILKAFAVSGGGAPNQVLSMFTGIAEMAICAGVSMSAELHFTGSGNMTAVLITSGIYISEVTALLPQVSIDSHKFLSNVNFTFDSSIPENSPVIIAYAPAFTNTVMAGFAGYDTSNGQDPSGFAGSGGIAVLMLDKDIPSSPYSLFVNTDTTFPYYTNSSTTHYHTAKTANEMKSLEFLSLLNADKNVFVADTDNLNNGYPVFPIRRVEQITYDGYIRNSVFEEYKKNQTNPISDSIYKLDIDVSGLISTLPDDTQIAMFSKTYTAPTSDNILSLIGGVAGVRQLCEKLKPANGTIVVVPFLAYIVPVLLISNSVYCLMMATGDKILAIPEDGCTINIMMQFSLYNNSPETASVVITIDNFNISSQSVTYNYILKEHNPAAPTAVVDSLTSTTTTNALSANQGRVLKGMIDKKVGSDEVSTIKKLTQSAYDSLSTKDSKTLYVIVG